MEKANNLTLFEKARGYALEPRLRMWIKSFEGFE